MQSQEVGSEGQGDEKSEEKREQASTSYQYIFQCQIAVNKMAELTAAVNYNRDYHQSSLIHVTESWLTEESAGIDLDGYTTIHFDRDK